MDNGSNEMKIYNEFIKGLKLEDIVLLELRVRRGIEQAMAGELIVDLQPDFHLMAQDGTSIKARADFDVHVTDSNDTLVFSLVASFMIVYRSSGGYVLSEEMEKQFVSRNVPVNIWPYARELIGSMTTRLGYPALLIEPYILIR